MTVRAKFVVNHVETYEDGGKMIYAAPVADGSEENKAFNDATPGGNLQLHIAAGKEAQKAFEQGKAYYIDFTPAN